MEGKVSGSYDLRTLWLRSTNKTFPSSLLEMHRNSVFYKPNLSNMINMFTRYAKVLDIDSHVLDLT